jgi:fructose-1,6-bisphosphatase II
MDRNLALEFVRVTEAAAIASAQWIGKGNPKAADGAAVEAMRKRFATIDFQGKVVIGEGKKDEAPELYTGEILGSGVGPEVDIAVDPLECTDSVANGRYNAIAVVATAERGGIFSAPDTYMQKIIVGPQAQGMIDLRSSVKDNLRRIAKVKNLDITSLVIAVLDRDRHELLVDTIRDTGARVRLISDGDVAAAVATCIPDSGIDVVMGVGGSTEAVLAAAALKIYGGDMVTRFAPINEKHQSILDENQLSTEVMYSVNDLVPGDSVTFTATGVIEGPMLPGVEYTNEHIITHSVVMRHLSGTVRFLKTYHQHFKDLDTI